MLTTNRYGLLVAAALVAGCASSQRSAGTNQDPFADPSKFENLASAAYTMPATLSAPAAEPMSDVALALATKPVHANFDLLTGSTLASPAMTFSPDYSFRADRAPAGVRNEEEVLSPETAFTDLIRGNERFVNGTIRAERRDDKRRREVAAVEKPFAVVLSCSDSRTPPELIFDQGLGDLVSIRVAGNVLGSAQVASIEDAVQNLGARLILVLGHESCSAVKAALEKPVRGKFASSASPDLDWLVTSIRPNLKSRGIASATADDPKFRKATTANIDAVTENLTVRSRIIADAVAKGKLKIVRGIHSLETGRVDFWGTK